MRRKMMIFMVVPLLLCGCMFGDFLGVGRPEWHFQKVEHDMLVVVNGFVKNAGRRPLCIGSLVAFALQNDEILATKTLTPNTLLQPCEQYQAGFVFLKENVLGITHIKIVISNNIFEPLENLTSDFLLVEIQRRRGNRWIRFEQRDKPRISKR